MNNNFHFSTPIHHTIIILNIKYTIGLTLNPKLINKFILVHTTKKNRDNNTLPINQKKKDINMTQSDTTKDQRMHIEIVG